jgi:putative tricarboxylic transport membrane protein
MIFFKHILIRARIEGLVILLVAGGYLWEAHRVPDFYKLPGVPGPTTFPLILGIVFAVCGLWLIVSPKELRARKRAAEEKPAASSAEPATAGGGLLSGVAADWHFYSLWAVILAYLYSMPDLGFPVATAVLIAVFVILLGERRWAVILGMALAATVLIYVSFKMGLSVRLPPGVLYPLLK